MLGLDHTVILSPLRPQVSWFSSFINLYITQETFIYTDDVYLSLNRGVIPNHGYVEIDVIGSTDDTALLCHTNHIPPPGQLSARDWFEPDRRIIPDAGIPGFTRKEGRMVMRLRRTTGDPPEGIYTCIMEVSFGVQTVYVGLYNSGRGMYILWQMILIFALRH